MGSGSSIDMPAETSIVVVGGGYAGVTIAKNLMSTGKVKLIDPKDSFFHNIGALRACVEPGFANKIFIPYKETFGEAFIRGTVATVNKGDNTVTLDDGQTISYTHLIIATGVAGSPFPGKVSVEHPNVTKAEGIELYKSAHEQITQADTIVCVGGGAVGVELAGELKTDFPKKNVILIHSNKTLCSSRLNRNAQSKLQALVKKKGIQLMLEERVANLTELQINEFVKDQTLRTESGKEIKSDLVFKCTGARSDTGLFREAFGSAVTERGQLKVDQFFKVEGTENIYAIGDITDIEEEKMSVAAGNHAELLAKNIKATFAGGKMKPYKTQDFLMIVPVGRDAGVGQLMGTVIGNFLCKNLKSKGLFVGRFWDVMGQKEPQLQHQ